MLEQSTDEDRADISILPVRVPTVYRVFFQIARSHNSTIPKQVGHWFISEVKSVMWNVKLISVLHWTQTKIPIRQTDRGSPTAPLSTSPSFNAGRSKYTVVCSHTLFVGKSARPQPWKQLRGLITQRGSNLQAAQVSMWQDNSLYAESCAPFLPCLVPSSVVCPRLGTQQPWQLPAMHGHAAGWGHSPPMEPWTGQPHGK